MEVYCQLIISKDLGYIKENQFLEIKSKIDKVNKLLSGLKKIIRNKIEQLIILNPSFIFYLLSFISLMANGNANRNVSASAIACVISTP